MQLKTIFNTANQWFSGTPERALDRAYRAALKIQDLEDKHFKGQRVSAQHSSYGESVTSYFKNEVQGYLQTINIALTEFKTSRFLLNFSEFFKPSSDARANLIEKLNFIDATVSKYKIPIIENGKVNEVSLTSLQKEQIKASNRVEKANNYKEKEERKKDSLLNFENDITSRNRAEKATEKTGILPRSFLKTVNRIKQEIDPKSGETEEEVIQRYRSSRYKTAISIRFILLLIIVPLLSHQLSKSFFVTPLVNRYLEEHPQIVFLNKDLEEEAFVELKHFEEMLEFRSLIGISPPLVPEEREKQIKQKADEVSEEFRRHGGDAIANVFADMFSLIAFTAVIVSNRREIEIVKSFIDEIIYGLSDSAKAFLIILFTDMFVGFHSPHGWEVILESISRHFGLPENRDFNFLFIATFPVILDTVFKYWIFRYLNRISPSAVATYRNMNE